MKVEFDVLETIQKYLLDLRHKKINNITPMTIINAMRGIRPCMLIDMENTLLDLYKQGWMGNGVICMPFTYIDGDFERNTVSFIYKPGLKYNYDNIRRKCFACKEKMDGLTIFCSEDSPGILNKCKFMARIGPLLS